MRPVRMLLVTLGLLGLSTAVPAFDVARASAPGVWVMVNPSSITAGQSVAIRASCTDNSTAATVRSKAFGSVTVRPLNSLLQSEVVVPPSTPQGAFTVTLVCRNGATATTTLWVNSKATKPPPGPHTGGGFLATHADSRGSTAGPPGAVLWLSGGMAALAIAGVCRVVATRRSRRIRGARTTHPETVGATNPGTVGATHPGTRR
jgi:hypothetical protein